MSFDIYRTIVDQAAEAGSKRTMLYWMADPLGDTLIIRKTEYAASKGLAVFISTNGAQLTQGVKMAKQH